MSQVLHVPAGGSPRVTKREQARSRPATRIAAVQALQATAGNAATTRSLQREEPAEPEESNWSVDDDTLGVSYETTGGSTQGSYTSRVKIKAALDEKIAALSATVANPAFAGDRPGAMAALEAAQADLEAVDQATTAQLQQLSDRQQLGVAVRTEGRQTTGKVTFEDGALTAGNTVTNQHRDGQGDSTVTEGRSGTFDANSASITDTVGAAYKGDDGSGRSNTTATTTTIGAGDGALTGGRSTTNSQSVTTAGGLTNGSSSTSGGSVSLVNGAEGSGLGGARTGANEWTRQQGPDGTKLKVGTTRAASGRFTVDVDLIDGQPPSYKVTLVLNVGGTLGGSAGASKGEDDAVNGNVGANASVGAGATATFVKVLSREQAAAYLGDLQSIESGSNPATGSPELGILARLRAAASLGGDAGDLGALVSSGAAAGLQEGESVDLDLKANASGGLSAGAKDGTDGRGKAGAGFSVSASARVGRKVTVARNGTGPSGKPKITVTVTFSSGHGSSVGANGSYGAASMGGTHSEDQGSSGQVVFDLDSGNPAYSAAFDAAASALTPTELEAAAAANPAFLASRTAGTSMSSANELTAGLGPLALGVGNTVAYEGSVTMGKGDGPTGSFTGSTGVNGSLQVGGVKVAQGGVNDAVGTAVDDAGGLTITLTQTHSSSDLLRSVRDYREGMEGRSTTDTLLDLATTGVGGTFKKVFEKTYDDLATMTISPDKLDVIVQRARDANTWSKACMGRYKLFDDWEQVRRAIVDPHPPADWSAVDKTPDQRFAKNLTRAHALATFGSSGELGARDAVGWVANRWGESTWSISTADDVADLAQWPSSMSKEQASLAIATKAADDLSADPDTKAAKDAAGAQATGADALRRFQKVRAAIEASEQIPARTKLEMLDAIQQSTAKLNAALVRIKELQSANASVAPAGYSDTTAEIAAGEYTFESSEGEVFSSEESMSSMSIDDAAGTANHHRIEALLTQLRFAKAEEKRLIDHGLSFLPWTVGGTHEPGAWARLSGAIDSDVAIKDKNEVAELHERWIRQVKELRQVYIDAGVGTQAWQVSVDAGAPRSELEPDVERLIWLHSAITEEVGGLANLHQEDLFRQWRDRCRY